MKKGKAYVSLAAVLLASAMVTPCGDSKKTSNYQDGTYSGRSSDFEADEDGNGAGYGTVEIMIKDNKVVECTFEMHELDGTLKDDSYGSDLSKENRLKAQKAVQSAKKYAQMLVEAGTTEDIDAISGATISHEEFLEAVDDALNKAAAEE